jgi:hypothetical protein
MGELIKGAIVAAAVTVGMYLAMFSALELKMQSEREFVSCFELKGKPACIAHDANGKVLWMKSPSRRMHFFTE